MLSTCTLDVFFYLSVLSSTEYIGYTCVYTNICAHTLRTHTYTHANTSQPALQEKCQLANRTTAFPPCLLRQEDVMLEAPSSFASDEFFMLTLIVNSTHAAFYQNLELLGVSAMPRPLTDCFNNLEGVILEHAHSVREACWCTLTRNKTYTQIKVHAMRTQCSLNRTYKYTNMSKHTYIGVLKHNHHLANPTISSLSTHNCQYI